MSNTKGYFKLCGVCNYSLPFYHCNQLGGCVSLTSLSQNPDAYFAKGTTEHLIFLRVMREAHQQYPFTGKKDYILIQQAMDVVLMQLPMLMTRRAQTESIFYTSTMSRISKQRKKKRLTDTTIETFSSSP